MHEGHRRRMYEKLKNDDGLRDHELLEILLFNAFPRKNTNPLAHSLLQTFGSLAGVFSADVEQLVTVDGVGESIALYLKCAGECIKRVSPNSAGIAVLKNHAAFKDFVIKRMQGKTVEVMEIYCLDKNGRVKRICPFTDEDVNKVVINSDKIAKLLATEKPSGIVAAHNHLGGSSKPSVSDEKFTAELMLLCSINNVALYDHVIYASEKDVYSFYMEGKIDALKQEFSFNSLVKERLDKLFGENSNGRA